MSTLQVIGVWALFVVALPSALGALVALPFWIQGHFIGGNIAGSSAIILVIVALIWQQFGVYVQAQESCVGVNCPARDSALTAFLVMAGLGWLDAFLLLLLSGLVEDRRRRQSFDRSRL